MLACSCTSAEVVIQDQHTGLDGGLDYCLPHYKDIDIYPIVNSEFCLFSLVSINVLNCYIPAEVCVGCQTCIQSLELH